MAEDSTPAMVRPFASVLQELAKGQVHSDASEALRELTTAVAEHGKKGTITVVIEVAPLPKGDGNTLIVSASVTSKPPRGETRPSVFYLDDDGNLVRDDPRQLKLDIRDAAEDQPQFREAK